MSPHFITLISLYLIQILVMIGHITNPFVSIFFWISCSILLLFCFTVYNLIRSAALSKHDIISINWDLTNETES